LEEEQIEMLKKLALKDSSFKSIKIRDGLAFLPPLFIGFLFMLFF
jgi:prepilin signal peptidase PulO-like enzyme (type II secretory pathway)